MCATRIAAATDRGPRDNLEDAFAASTLFLPFREGGQEITTCLGLDGVGGQRHGEVASAHGSDCIISSIMASFALARPSDDDLFVPDRVLSVIEFSLECANESVLQQIKLNPKLEGMSTTAVCAVIAGGKLFVGWVGDSACFVCNHNQIRKITHDHSEVQRLIDAGLLSEKNAKSHPLSHVITRFIGQPRGFCPETNTCRLFDGDIVLICTDGLMDVLTDKEILEHVQLFQEGRFSFDELPKRLIRRALEAGTRDNVTVLCCEYHAEPQSFSRTLTGAYPAAAAKAIQDFHKEAINA